MARIRGRRARPRWRPTTTRRPHPHVQEPGSPTRTPKTPQGRRAGGGSTCKVSRVAVQYGRNSRCSVEICVPPVAAASRRCCRPVWWSGLTPFARKNGLPCPLDDGDLERRRRMGFPQPPASKYVRGRLSLQDHRRKGCTPGDSAMKLNVMMRFCVHALRQLQRRRHADSEGAGAADDAVRPLEGLRDPEHEEGALGQARLAELVGCGTLDFCAAGFLTAARSRAVLRARSASARSSAWPRAYPSGLGPPAWLRAVLLRRWRASNDAAAALARQGIFIVD